MRRRCIIIAVLLGALPLANGAMAQTPQHVIKVRGGIEIKGNINFQDRSDILFKSVSGTQHQISKSDVIWIKLGHQIITER